MSACVCGPPYADVMFVFAVGRDWRWKMDDPLTIVHGAIDNHVRMINEYKGVPGVQAARLQEGFQVMLVGGGTAALCLCLPCVALHVLCCTVLYCTVLRCPVVRCPSVMLHCACCLLCCVFALWVQILCNAEC